MLLRRLLTAGLCAASACLLPALVSAQDYAPTLQPSLAAQCLAPAAAERGQPEYPADLLERKDGGVVKLELVFTAPDRAPVVRVLDENADPKFLRSVRAHVAQFRVPCMTAGAEPARLVQTYVFTPNDGRTVMASAPRDADEAQRRLRYRCLQRIVPGVRPDYPLNALRADEQGTFLVRLRFAGATAEPEAVFLDADRSPRLRGAVTDFVKGYRLPCMDAEPVELDVLFSFLIQGGARTRLKDSTLRGFLGDVDPSTLSMPVYFDLDSMACPFDVRLRYQRPHAKNEVLEVDNSNPARQPLLDWLSQMSLRLPADTNRRVLGETMTVSIPCGKIDLRSDSSPPKPTSTSTSTQEKS